MKTFHCTHCQAQVFFDNVACLNCGSLLAYLPDHGAMAALRESREGVYSPSGPDILGQYRLCANYPRHSVCNWAVPIKDPNPLCASCRLTEVIPQLSPLGKIAWQRLEAAKRRLVYGLSSLQLGLQRKSESAPQGVRFQFLQDATGPNGDAQRVLTGHDNGLITLNIDEADDLKRERQRVTQHEPYRTLLGHFRHEIGHYFWDRLIRDSARLEEFRRLFGDERADYAEALRHHYRAGARENWQDTHISAYAASHPWEDWAETSAHFLHMSDALETASALGLSLNPARSGEPTGPSLPADQAVLDAGFDKMIDRWLTLTYVMNSLSRGLGLADSYPFVLSPTVMDKLRFVFEVINQERRSESMAAASGPGGSDSPARTNS
jgi:hypothetical protein